MSDFSDVRRRLTAILQADVVGYSTMMSKDEEGTLRQIAAAEKALKPIISGRNGRIFKRVGDALLVGFSSAVDALLCATEWQPTVVGHTAGIRYRIGMHLGDAVISGDDNFGEVVNIAARLEKLAPPGGILVSGAVFREVARKTNVQFLDDGEQSLHNIPKKVRVYRVVRTLFRAASSLPTPDFNVQRVIARSARPHYGVEPERPFEIDEARMEHVVYCKGYSIAEDLVDDVTKQDGSSAEKKFSDWPRVCIGEPPASLGRIPVALRLAEALGASCLIWSTGATYYKGISEAEYMFRIGLEYLASTERQEWLRQISLIEDESRDTEQAMIQLSRIILARFPAKPIMLHLVTSANHAPRLARDATIALADARHVVISVVPAQTSYGNRTPAEVKVGDLGDIPLT